MRRLRVTLVGTLCALSLAAAGCANNSSDSGGGDVELGLLTSLSGNASAAFKSTREGVDARLDAYKADKGKCADTTINVVQADDTSSPQGAQAATQRLVQQDKVDAILEISPYFFGAAPYAVGAGKDTPIIGAAIDGATQWESPDNNLFPAFPVPDPHRAFTTAGQYFKSIGATRVAGLAYNSPSAKPSLENALKSVEAAGLTRGYVNNSIPFGSTDVGAIVLGIIKSKADAVTLAINPETAFAVVAGLRQANYPVKAVVSASGYGADLLESAPAVQAAQGVVFTVVWAPVELRTPAVTEMSTYMKKHGVPEGIPGLNQTIGWLSTDLYLHALEKVDCDASSDRLMTLLRADKSWNGGGLYPLAFDFTKPLADKQCLYYVRLEGKAFVPESQAKPICGGPLG